MPDREDDMNAQSADAPVDTSDRYSSASTIAEHSPAVPLPPDEPTVSNPPSPTGYSRSHQNALGINVPSVPITPGPLTAPPTQSFSRTARLHRSGPSVPAPAPAPVLRRTASGMSAGSASGSGAGAREKKRLRFTPVIDTELARRSSYDENAVSPAGSRDISDEEWMADTESEGSRDGRRRYQSMRSDPGTPNLAETADQIRRTLSLASLDHLILISANKSGERDKLLSEVQKAGKDLVWRDSKEKRLYPKDVERTSVLAAKRGLRSFLLAFSVRAGVNVLLTLFRTLRKRNLRVRMILHAIFGAEPFRFGAMIGTFTFLNTLTLHLLRLAPPLSYIRRRVKAGLFTQTSFGPPQREGAEGERRWQAAVAGAVGSLGLLWETRARRRGVAQQMFVRGLQGTYNHYTPRYGIHIPHGDVLLFGLCCGQIMFAFLMSPETIPREYNSWIQSASQVPQYAVAANMSSVRQGRIDSGLVEKALQHKFITSRNRHVLETVLQGIKDGWQPPAAAPCEMVHPWLDSCRTTSFRRFFSVMRFMLPVYSALHLIPALVLRRQHFQSQPMRMLLKVMWGITRSCSFLGGFVVIYQALFCLRSQILWDRLKLSNNLKWIIRLIKGKQVFWGIGFATCASLFLEEKRRRAELAMYVLPRALESAWSSARKRAYVPIVPFGETILGAMAMAMVMDTYKHKPQALSGVVRRLMFQLVGPV